MMLEKLGQYFLDKENYGVISVAMFWLFIPLFLLLAGAKNDTTISNFVAETSGRLLYFQIILLISIACFAVYVWSNPGFLKTTYLRVMLWILIVSEILVALIPSKGSFMKVHGIIALVVFGSMLLITLLLALDREFRKYRLLVMAMIVASIVLWARYPKYSLSFELLLIGSFHTNWIVEAFRTTRKTIAKA